MSWNLLFMIALIAYTGWATAASDPETVLKQKILDKYHLTLDSGVRMERTEYPGIWALRTKQASRYPAYVDDTLSYTINFPDAKGLVSHIPNGDDPTTLLQRRAILVKSIPLHKFIAMRGSTPFAAIVYSSPQCPYSQKMEAFLTKEKISYYIAPTSLNSDGIRWAESLFCAKNPRQAWHSAMTEHLEGDGGHCSSFPYQSAEDMAYIFMVDGQHRPGVPAMIFADGTAVSGWDDKRASTLRQKMSEGIFFK